MNVELGDVGVSRHDRAELARDVAELEKRLSQRSLRVRVAGVTFDLAPSAIGFRIDREATISAVLAAGRQGGLLAELGQFLSRCTHASQVPPRVALDDAAFARTLEDWQAKALRERPFAGDLEISATEVKPRPPRGGRAVVLQEAKQLVLESLASVAAREITLPVRDVAAPRPPELLAHLAEEAKALIAKPIQLGLFEPAVELTLSREVLAGALRLDESGGHPRLAFDREALRTALERERGTIEREAVDARFEIGERDEISIVPSTPGLRIDFERLPGAVLDAGRGAKSAALPVKHEPLPKLDTSQAEALGIRGLVSSFTTRHACCERRVENIHRIADLIDGLVVRPGETVSINEVVGPRTLKNGFVPAPTIEEGEMVETPGGGVSQFATTIFNALFHGGYDIVERQPHTYWFPRYPMGHEATLSWPKPDVIFRNDTTAGLLIDTSYTSTSITVKLYGDNGGRKVKAQVSPRSNVTEPAMVLEPNPTLEPNRERVKDAGMIGWSVIVSRILTFPDGTTREEKRRVTYKPKPRRVEVHPCRIPKGEKGYTGERCPEPKDAEIVVEETSEQ